MPDEDVQKVKAEEAAAPSTEVKKEAEKKPEADKTMPDKGFFDDDHMDKFIDSMELAKDDKPAVKPDKPTEEAKKEDCVNCDEEGRKPIHSYVHNGETIHLYTQEEVTERLQKSHNVDFRLDRAKEHEQSLKTREADLGDVRTAIETLTSAISPQGKAGADQTGAEGEVDFDLIADPKVAEMLKTVMGEVTQLKGENQALKQGKQHEDLTKAAQEMDRLYVEIQKETPFDQIKDPATGDNITERLFSGLTATMYNTDRAAAHKDSDHEIKTMSQYFKLAGSALNHIESHYKTKYGGEGAAEITADSLLEHHPDVAQEIGQKAIAEHLRQVGDAVPIARTEKADAVREPESKDKDKKVTLDSLMDDAVNDPEIAAELERAAQMHPK